MMAKECKRDKGKADLQELEWAKWERRLGFSKEALRIQSSEPEEKSAPPQTLDPSPNLLLPLLPYQKEFLAWSMKQEKSRIKGGILADEMGMGKTIQAISLILTSPQTATNSPLISNKQQGVPLPQVKATLIVCPSAAIRHWMNEITERTKKGSVKVMVYDRCKKCVGIQEVSEYDIILTTHQTIQKDHKDATLPPKPKTACEVCGKLFPPAKLKEVAFNWLMCAACDQKRETKCSQLDRDLVEGLELLAGVAEAVDVRVGATGTARRSKKKKETETDDIDPVEDPSPVLHAVKWNRLILDEAHYPENKSNSTRRALFALESNYKWALTKNPLQNHPEELQYLINFLEVEPFAYNYCSHCNCKSLESCRPNPSSELKRCHKCQHLCSIHFLWWKKYLGNYSILNRYLIEDKQKAMKVLQHKVLDCICLRRTKHERIAEIGILPPRTVVVRRDTLDADEKHQYKKFYRKNRIQFHRGIDYEQVLKILNSLRQAVNHPCLINYQDKTSKLAAQHHLGSASSSTGPIMCCKETCKNYIQNNTTDDIESTNRQDSHCPILENLVRAEDVKKALGIKRSSILSQIDLQNFVTSTKIEALSGVKCIMLDRSMTIKDREKIMQKFANDCDFKVMLLCVYEGEVFHDLTVASHVFLMDAWWSQAAEQLAEARTYQLDQHRPVKVVRFTIENTVDERILQLQERKQFDLKYLRRRGRHVIRELSEADIKFLFS